MSEANRGVFSVRSERVRRAARLASSLYRRKTGEFLVEGPQALREGLRTDCLIEVFATEQASEQYAELAVQAQECQIPWHQVNEDVVHHIADTVRPQGLVARARQITQSMQDHQANDFDLLLVAVDVRDPGNAGSLARVADAAGAGAVVLAGDCVDIHNPKSVRASVGSIFHLPVLYERDVAAVMDWLTDGQLQILAADGDGSTSLFSSTLALSRPTAWLLGNEAHGLANHTAITSAIDYRVQVPIFGQAESLNLATAAAVCLYASAHARVQ